MATEITRETKAFLRVVGKALWLIALLPFYAIILYFFSTEEYELLFAVSLAYLFGLITFLLWLYYKVILATSQSA